MVRSFSSHSHSTYKDPDKSHVGMGHDLCPVCLKSTNETVLLDKRMRPTLDRYNFTGWSMCSEHQKMLDDGYVAIVETSNPNPTLSNAVRTGQIAHIRKSVWPEIFNTSVPEQMLCFAPKEVLEFLKTIPVAEDKP